MVMKFEHMIAIGAFLMAVGLVLTAPQPFVHRGERKLFSFGCSSVIVKWALQMVSIVFTSAGCSMLFIPGLPLMQKAVRHLGNEAVEKVASLFIAGLTIGEALGPLFGGWLVG